MLTEDATLLEGVERSQVVGSRCKEVVSRDEERQWPSKKAREKQSGKYHRNTTVKIKGANSYERCMCARQDYLVHHLR